MNEQFVDQAPNRVFHRVVQAGFLGVTLFVGACVAGVERTRLPLPQPSARVAATPAPAGILRIGGVVRLTTPDGVKLPARADLAGETGRLISNNNGRLVSNNGAGLVSNGSGGLVADGAGLVSNNGAGFGSSRWLTALSGFRIVSTVAAAPEDRLVEAVVEVLDATGQVVRDRTGKPVQTVTDAAGQFVLNTQLTEQNVILRVKLNEALAGSGRELRAMVTRGVPTTAIDSASSMSAAYVLEQYVQGQTERFERLTADANAQLTRDMVSARGLLGRTALDYGAQSLQDVVGDLRTRTSELNNTLEMVKTLLLLGQKDLGAGLPAREVPFSLPVAVARDAAGRIFIAEEFAARIRVVNPDGRVNLFAGDKGVNAFVPGISRDALGFASVSDMTLHPKGGLLVVDSGANAVYWLKPDGVVERLVNGAERPGFSQLSVVSAGSDGTILCSSGGNILRLDGPAPTEVEPPALSGGYKVDGLAVAGDGAYWCIQRGTLFRRERSTDNWNPVVVSGQFGSYGRLAPVGDLDVYATESDGDRIIRVSPDGTVRTVVGTGRLGEAPDVNIRGRDSGTSLLRPAGMAVAPDGKVLVANYWRQVVQECDPDQLVSGLSIIAGVDASDVKASNDVLAVNGPSGLDWLPGRDGFVYSESGANLVRQFEAGRASVLAGGRVWNLTPSVKAVDAALTAPIATRFDRQGNLWILESVASRLLKVAPDGTVRVMAGNGQVFRNGSVAPQFDPTGKDPRSLQFGRPTALVIGPDNQPYWTDQAYNIVCTLTADARVVTVVGPTPAMKSDGGDGGDGGPAAQASLRWPMSLAFDAAGDLYISDTGNFRVRRVAMGQPDRPISSFLGVGMVQSVLRLAQKTTQNLPGREPVEEALTILPGPLCFDANNRLYVAEVGSQRASTVFQGNGLTLPAQFPVVGARIRRVDLAAPSRVIETIAGVGTSLLSAETGNDALGLPIGMLVDDSGRLIIADVLNNQIKLAQLP